MIVTLFHWRLHPGARDRFVGHWAAVTELLKPHGSLGSALFEQPDGTLRAIARWPDRATRDAAFAADPAPEDSAAMRACIAQTIERVDLDAVRILWTDRP